MAFVAEVINLPELTLVDNWWHSAIFDDSGRVLVLKRTSRRNLLHSPRSPNLFEKDLPLDTLPGWEYRSEPDHNVVSDLALYDVNGDGRLDLFIGDANYSDLHLNTGDTSMIMDTIPVWTDPYCGMTEAVDFGDIDGDGDLDLAEANYPFGSGDGHNRVYRDVGPNLESTPFWQSDETDYSWGVAWGDVDNDGYPELAIANWMGQSNAVYKNNNGTLETTASWRSTERDWTADVEWADIDGDGYPDLVVGNHGDYGPSLRVYHNDGGDLETTASWSANAYFLTFAIACGDVDNDGDIDVAVTNYDKPIAVFYNLGDSLESYPSWFSNPLPTPYASILDLVWGDVDNDGDLDLAAANQGSAASNAQYVYENVGDSLESDPSWLSHGREINCNAIVWGDVTGNGNLDLVTGGSSWASYTSIYFNLLSPGIAESYQTAEHIEFLQCFPNPFVERLNIRFITPNNSGRLQILPILKIWDISGRVVKTFTEVHHQSTNQIMWNGRDDQGRELPDGIYFVGVERLDHKELKKVVKHSG